MAYPYFIEIGDTPRNSVLLTPRAVVAVFQHEKECKAILSNGRSIALPCSADYAAKLLWSCLNRFPGGYFNDQHLLAVTHTDQGSVLHLAGNVTLTTDVSVEAWRVAIQVAETQRATLSEP